MYVNKCTKCGCEFETKNPKRVICPNCLYPDKKMMVSGDGGENRGDDQQKAPEQNASSTAQEEKTENTQHYSSYTAEPPQQQQSNYYSYGGRPQNDYPRRDNGGYNRDGGQGGGYNRGGYNRDNQQGGGYNRGGYNRPQNGGGYNRGGYNRDNQQGGGYNRPQGGYNRDNQQGGGYNRSQGGYNRPQGGGFNRGGYNRPQNGGGFNRGGGRFNAQRGGRPGGNRPSRPLLVNKEQLEQIELLYRAMLPLPNPDAHEVIGEKIGLEPRNVFFGITLVRQKMMLPKLPFPKRKLAITPDQLNAIKMLYEPLLPLPPIGCHK